MSGLATVLVTMLAVYVGVGLLAAAAFVMGAASRACAPPASVTPGARLLMLPGAILLWPVLLRRWMQSRP